MSFNIIWDDQDKTILRQIYNEDSTVESYYESIEVAASYLATVRHYVDVIIQFEGDNPSCRHNFISNIAAHAGHSTPDNQGLVVIITPRNTFTKMSKEALNRLRQCEWALVDNLNHAYELIHNYRLHQSATT